MTIEEYFMKHPLEFTYPATEADTISLIKESIEGLSKHYPIKWHDEIVVLEEVPYVKIKVACLGDNFAAGFASIGLLIAKTLDMNNL